MTEITIITGFLGAGKTTLLRRWIEQLLASGARPALILNELGDVDVEGALRTRDLPSAQVLGGCVCCSSSHDLTAELHELLRKHQPTRVFIETTGAANPLELVDITSEASLYHRGVKVGAVVTVVDGAAMLALRPRGGRTWRLLCDQIRCATHIVLNKRDRLQGEALGEALQGVREWNAHAPIYVAEHADVDVKLLEVGEGSGIMTPTFLPTVAVAQPHAHEHTHLVAYTHELERSYEMDKFEAFLRSLPDNVYRAKGIVTFRETGSRYMFQYAYREPEFIRIHPQGDVFDVAVFIGEQFAREPLIEQLALL